MPQPRNKYETITEWTREDVAQALLDNDPEALLRAVVAVSMYDADWSYAQGLCVRLSCHDHFNVRGNAVLGFGHIARVHGRLDRELVQPIIRAALKDADAYVRGHGIGAADDTVHFLGWSYEQ